jgi:NADPH:quinone reductase-like Zn-dependent oxidoreductase
MPAMVYTRYGPPAVLQLTEIARPLPGDHDVLIKVQAASLNPADWHYVRGTPLLFRPALGGLLRSKYTIPGADLAGLVEAVGRDVQRFQPGDAVFGDLSGYGRGTLAAYVCVREEAALALKPAGLSFEQAAAVPLAALTALQGLRDHGQIQPGQQVLITGASGGVGTFAVQIAKSFGAEVTGVCSTRNLDLVRALGADRVIDYTHEDVTRRGQRFDLILDCAAYRSFPEYRRALCRQGRYVLVGGAMPRVFQVMLAAPLLSSIGSRTYRTFVERANTKDLVYLTALLDAGKVVPVIDRCYPLHEAAEALRYLEAGHARGKVVITVDQGTNT